MTGDGWVVTRREGAVLRITLNRPDRRNALTPGMAHAQRVKAAPRTLLSAIPGPEEEVTPSLPA